MSSAQVYNRSLFAVILWSPRPVPRDSGGVAAMGNMLNAATGGAGGGVDGKEVRRMTSKERIALAEKKRKEELMGGAAVRASVNSKLTKQG